MRLNPRIVVLDILIPHIPPGTSTVVLCHLGFRINGLYSEVLSRMSNRVNYVSVGLIWLKLSVD